MQFCKYLVANLTAPNITTHRVSGVLNPCNLEVLNIVVFAAFAYLTLLVCLYLRCSKKHRRSASVAHGCRFVGHTLRALLSLLLLLTHLAHLAAGLLTPLLPLSAATALLAWPVSQLLYASAETVREPRYLLVHALFWVTCGLARGASLFSASDSGLVMDTNLLRLPVVPLTAGAASLLCYALAVLDVVAVVCELKLLKQNGLAAKSVPAFHSYRHHEVGFYSRVVFYWLFPLLWQGYSKPLEYSDLGSLPPPETTTTQHERFYQVYQAKASQEKCERVSLWGCYVRCYWSNFALGGLLKLMGDCISIVPSLGISVVIAYISHPPNNVGVLRLVTISDLLENGYVMAAIVLLSAVAQGSLSQASTHIVSVDGIRLRTALQALVYRKALRLRGLGQEEEGSHESRSGKLINLLSEDTTDIMSCYWIGHYVWAIPLKIIILLYLLYTKLGVSAIIGASCCILTLTPLQFIIGKKMSTNVKLISEQGDKRLRQTNEVLQGLRLLKLCGWEDKFTERISLTRKRELTLLNKESLYLALLTFLTHMSSAMITLVTLAAYHYLGDQDRTKFSAENVFSGLALFNQLTVPLFIFPITVPRIIAACASTRRLEEFLIQPEIQSLVPAGGCTLASPTQPESPAVSETKPASNVNETKRRSRTESGFGLGNITELEEPGDDTEEDVMEVKMEERAVSVEGATFRWSPSDSFALVVPQLHIRRGKLTLVFGPTGSGKSSLLSALLGEIPCANGTVSWASNSAIAYVSQRPWLLNGTLQDNITFGQKLVRRRYESVITATALQSDINILPHKDGTDIGERGINLSGGQRQRVAIARALYSMANVVIMDDPLSALDHQVALQVFNQGVKRLVTSQRRTVILATHNRQFFEHADQVVMLENGKVVACCSPSEMKRRGMSLASDEGQEESVGKTARERWQLLKLVTLRQRQPTPSDSSLPTDHINPSKFVPFTRRLSKFSGSRYFTHDLLLPTDECETSEVLERPRSSSTSGPNSTYKTFSRRLHAERWVSRTISLQVSGPRIMRPVTRQASSPIICSRNRTRSENRRASVSSVGRFRAIFSLKTHRNLSTVSDSSVTEHNRQLLSTSSTNSAPAVGVSGGPPPLMHMTSTVSECSDVFIDNDESVEGTVYDLSGCGGPEEREYGQIEQRVYLSYLDACGGALGFTFLASTISWHGLRVATDYWLTCWTKEAREQLSGEESLWYLEWYGVFSAATVCLSLLSTGLGQYCGAQARRRLHDNMLVGLFNCPIRFFETTPLGRIMNRFTTDLGIIDKKIAISIQRLLQFILLCLSAIVVNCVVTPYFLILAVPICLLYYVIQKFYRCSSRELQRIDSLSRSPIQSHFSETLVGLETIRAFGHQERFTRNMFYKIDVNTNSFLALNSCNRWLGVVLDYLGAVIVFAAMLVSLLTADLLSGRAHVNVALIGLAINYTLLVPVYLNWVVYFINDMEMYMGAVERVLQFATEPTEDFNTTGYLPQGWPSAGEIKFDNVSLLYETNGNLNTIIANLNLCIPAGQKIGICGRTGSGKSSLAMALFNMVTVSAGTIFIDGLDIFRVPVKRLRSQLSVIPQDVIMFSGTIRENLDLRGEYTDDQLWQSLEIAQMKETITNLGGLDWTVQEGGGNLSCGQRQLLCLARAVLHRSTVLVMDEATSSLDPITEQTLLDVAGQAFEGKTVITIAHRSAVLSRCDRVIVLEGGRIVQDGPPGELRQQTMGAFASLLRAAEDHS